MSQANPHIVTDDEWDVFYDAVRCGDYRFVAQQLETHLEAYRRYDVTLAVAASKDAEMAELLIRSGADVNAKTCLGNSSPLHHVAHWNKTFLIEILLAHGADINSVDLRGNTPLFEAVTSDESAGEAAQQLIARGAHVDLETAVALGDAVRVKALLEADPGLAQRSRCALVYLAVSEAYMRWQLSDEVEQEVFADGIADLLRVLVQYGADVNECEPSQGETALYLAVEGDAIPFASLLVALGADPHVRSTYSGETPLEAATSREMVQLLQRTKRNTSES